MRRLLSLVSLVAVAFGTLAPHSAEASSQGLSVTAYSISEFPPTRSDTEHPLCGFRVDPFVNIQYEYDPIGSCGGDAFLVHYEGFVTIPEGVSSVRFAIASDDGSHFTIDGTTFGDWSDKGCSADYSPRLAFPTGSPLALDGWIYENGGGTCAMLMWQFDADNADWNIVPPEAFTVDAVPPTTTTSTVTTSTTTTTTATTTSTTSTTSSTTSTSTTSTTIPATTTSHQLPSSTVSPSSTAAQAISNPPTATLSSTVSPAPTTTAVIIAPTSTLNAPTTITPTTLSATTTSVVTKPDAPTMSSTEAVERATDPEVVASLSSEEAEIVFASIDESALTMEEASLIVEAVQNAPDEVREAFEEKVNVFGGKTDDYVPLFSNIPVGERRTMIAATGMLTVVPPPRRRLT
jgi:hypothetical protein